MRNGRLRTVCLDGNKVKNIIYGRAFLRILLVTRYSYVYSVRCVFGRNSAEKIDKVDQRMLHGKSADSGAVGRWQGKLQVVHPSRVYSKAKEESHLLV